MGKKNKKTKETARNETEQIQDSVKAAVPENLNNNYRNSVVREAKENRQKGQP